MTHSSESEAYIMRLSLFRKKGNSNLMLNQQKLLNFYGGTLELCHLSLLLVGTLLFVSIGIKRLIF